MKRLIVLLVLLLAVIGTALLAQPQAQHPDPPDPCQVCGGSGGGSGAQCSAGQTTTQTGPCSNNPGVTAEMAYKCVNGRWTFDYWVRPCP